MSILLPEPPPANRYDLRFTLFNIPIRIHPLFWLMLILVGASFDSLSETLIWIVVALIAVLVHELGTALVMRLFGKPSHITLYFLGGYTEPESILWGNRWATIRLNPNQEIISSLAGPLAGFLLAMIVKVGIITAGGSIAITLASDEIPLLLKVNASLPMDSTTALSFLLKFLLMLFWVNIFWGIINLMPIYPLDGGNIIRSLLARVDPQNGISKSARVSIVFAIIVAVLGIFFLGNLYFPFLFGFLAFQNYQLLQGNRADGF